MRFTALLICALLLSGCVTMGREITEEQLAGFKKGETTVQDVTSKLGTPTSSSVTATGQRTLSYMFAHSQARPGTFVPIIGPLIGGADTRSSMVIFIFGADGKLQDFHASQSQLGSGFGAAAGQYQPPYADQPSEAPRK